MSTSRAFRVAAPLLLALSLGLVLGAACKGKDKDQGAAKDPPRGPTAEGSRVTLTVDGKEVGSVDRGRAGQWPPLAALLPESARDPAGWGSLEVELATGKPIKFDGPAAGSPGHVAALYPGTSGISFGMFTPEQLAQKGKPGRELPNVVAIRLTLKVGGRGGGDSGGGGNESDTERPRPSAALTFTIKAGDQEVVFTGDKLESIPTITAPIGDTDTPGWSLVDVMKAAGVEPKGRLFIEGTEGANLLLEASDLDPATAVLFIKLNRSGQLRFRIFRKTATTWEIGGELRGIHSIELR
ncbi:MAG: hypothetical protein H6709_24675 [Kofleriaceae bacterium]|nr:hypothetical protein [Kofleriaceae bacterium]MCB9575284.1 hypothetical protein [Kofleriaceae bacterium]